MNYENSVKYALVNPRDCGRDIVRIFEEYQREGASLDESIILLCSLEIFDPLRVQTSKSYGLLESEFREGSLSRKELDVFAYKSLFDSSTNTGLSDASSSYPVTESALR